jgi:hypothetical protein
MFVIFFKVFMLLPNILTSSAKPEADVYYLISNPLSLPMAWVAQSV